MFFQAGAPVGAALIVAAVVVSRRTDALVTPQFWAEDGRIWYQDAVNNGALKAALTPAAGYFQTFSRLTAALSLPFGLENAPLIFAVAAVVIQILSPLFVLSSRFAQTIRPFPLRALAALLIVGAPNTWEVHANVTNAQTHLALLSVLIVVSDPVPGLRWYIFDIVAVIVAGLAGPTGVLLVPVATLAWMWRPTRRQFVILLAIILPATLQMIAFACTSRSRGDAPLGATPLGFLESLGGQVFVAGSLGSRIYSLVYGLGDPMAARWTAVTGAVGLVLVVRVVLTASVPVRLLILFAMSVLGAALWSPVVVAPLRWDAMRIPNTTTRYYVLPIVAYLAALLWSACLEPRRVPRALSRALLVIVVTLGVALDWVIPPRRDLNFAGNVARYREAPAGTLVTIPIPPDGWEMRLLKR